MSLVIILLLSLSASPFLYMSLLASRMGHPPILALGAYGGFFLESGLLRTSGPMPKSHSYYNWEIIATARNRWSAEVNYSKENPGGWKVRDERGEA
ncbi:hypothetical protein B0F90DRAFT_898484 [Multifurca ochricompacta]|uniref:NADH dehydrogenase subunit 5 n=1 Tax=Multifurca ochricompacta TaxID=376703 RepID=A0AAD4M114_9AGAM|nr:hypothetical protein B0F90DRAFT_898484 [Multifurca ochricompacta]